MTLNYLSFVRRQIAISLLHYNKENLALDFLQKTKRNGAGIPDWLDVHFPLPNGSWHDGDAMSSINYVNSVCRQELGVEE